MFTILTKQIIANGGFEQFKKFQANLWILILKPSDAVQQIHSYKKGLYKWDLVRFNHTNQKIIMTNIRDDLMCSSSTCIFFNAHRQNWRDIILGAVAAVP